MGAAIKHPVPDLVKPSLWNFWHPGTLTLRAERHWASECPHLQLTAYNPVWYRMLNSCRGGVCLITATDHNGPQLMMMNMHSSLYLYVHCICIVSLRPGVDTFTRQNFYATQLIVFLKTL